SEGRVGLAPRQRLVTYALGLAGGLGVNTLSNDVGYRGAAAAAGVGIEIGHVPSWKPLTGDVPWLVIEPPLGSLARPRQRQDGRGSSRYSSWHPA
ncbi:MAG: hypothetical protein ACRDRX_20950, partial [Pseudonocardiaceae bacterium]